ncbi:PTS cellobiose transporter subunit IIC [Enterococcus faecium]|uniref:PTS cellobiose transporter subunit IIC n=1 Tax=Enterococcus faecium TaxID=1352 RepID=UPI00295F3A6F|nr:PTS cellobiose transporter subunit IIC [Enterococcus faecium]WOV56326.1 PTS cellobiose transporter subunit IIC [Enterococcus faecium]
MQKLFKAFEKNLMGPIGRLASYKIVRAVMTAGIVTIPFTIVGSAFLIIGVLPETFTGLQGIWDVSFSKINDLYMIANTFTMGVLAMFFCLVVGYELTKMMASEDHLDVDPLNGALLSLMAFLFIIPELKIDGGVYKLVTNITENTHVYNGISLENFSTRLGTSGIFQGVLMACLAIYLYAFCVRHNWTIKLPEVVPPGVGRAFSALIPCAVISITVLLIEGLLVLFGYDLFTVIGIPFNFIAGIASTWYGVALSCFFIGLLWSVGIHGASIIGAIIEPISLQNLGINVAIANGVAAAGTQSMVYAGGFTDTLVSIGGSGGTFGLILLMLFGAKSQQLKAVSKIGVVPAIFNINEPIIFGLPVIYNPYLMIPFIIGPVAASLVSYFAISVGIVNPMIASVPWATPLGLGAFLGTGGDFRAILLVIVNLALLTAIYFPFFKAYDNDLYKKELAAAAAE